jgi:septal ring factor EnvC (AmiA/AmiB activator)
MGAAMIDGSTQVSFTMTQLLTAVVTAMILLCGGLWTVLTLTTSGLRDDVSVIRQSTQGLQVADKDTAVRLREAELRLADQISGLRTEIASFVGRLESTNTNVANLNTNVASLSRRIEDFGKQLAARQAAFSDPKNISIFTDRLRDATAGAKDGTVVVVPFEPAFQMVPK